MITEVVKAPTPRKLRRSAHRLRDVGFPESASLLEAISKNSELIVAVTKEG